MDSSDIGRRGLLLGGLASSWSLTSCTSSAPVVQAASPRRYADRPAIMAVGDSPYQGVRSLSFTSELALHSPPVQVARSLSLPMTVPDPARPILFDLEARLRQGVSELSRPRYGRRL
jgi:hypothetical protein